MFITCLDTLATFLSIFFVKDAIELRVIVWLLTAVLTALVMAILTTLVIVVSTGNGGLIALATAAAISSADGGRGGGAGGFESCRKTAFPKLRRST